MTPTRRTTQQRDQRFARIRRIAQAIFVGSGVASALLVAFVANSAKSQTTTVASIPAGATITSSSTASSSATTAVTTSTITRTGTGTGATGTSKSATTPTTTATATPVTTTTVAPVTTTTRIVCYTSASGHQTCYYQ